MVKTLSISLTAFLSCLFAFGQPKSSIAKCPCEGDEHVIQSTVGHGTNRTLSFGIDTYFQNLFTYAPINLFNSCGFVSLISYLCYFDNFYNDALIPQPYERTVSAATQNDALSTSPGVQRLAMGGMTLTQFVNNNKDNDFQCQLIYLYKNAAGLNEYHSSIGMWDYHYVLDALYGTGTVPFEVHYWDQYPGQMSWPTTQQILKSYIVSVLQLGVPVIVHYANNSGQTYPDHSVVAYKYDANGIHAHFGWGNDSTDLILGDDEYISHVGYADFSSFSFSHSKNYTISGLNYCGCGQHVFHTFTYSQIVLSPDIDSDETEGERIPGTKHRASCACGYHTSESHFRYPDSPLGVCAGCGATSNFLLVRDHDND